MKRVSFFLVLIILLAGVPSLAAGPQSEFLQSFFDNPEPPAGSSFDGFGTQSMQLQNIDYVGIPGAYVSTDPSDPSSNSWSAPDGYEIVEYHFAYIMCCSAHSASSGSYTAAGLTGFGDAWIDAWGATSADISISSNGVPGFSEAALTGAYIQPMSTGPSRYLVIDDISVSGTEVTIEYTFHSSITNEAVYYGNVDYYPDNDPSASSSLGFGGWLYDGDSSSVSVDVGASGTWWFNVQRLTLSSDVAESGWVSVEVEIGEPSASVSLLGVDEYGYSRDDNINFEWQYDDASWPQTEWKLEFWSVVTSDSVVIQGNSETQYPTASDSIDAGLHNNIWEWNLSVRSVEGDWYVIGQGSTDYTDHPDYHPPIVVAVAPQVLSHSYDSNEDTIQFTWEFDVTIDSALLGGDPCTVQAGTSVICIATLPARERYEATLWVEDQSGKSGTLVVEIEEPEMLGTMPHTTGGSESFTAMMDPISPVICIPPGAGTMPGGRVIQEISTTFLSGKPRSKVAEYFWEFQFMVRDDGSVAALPSSAYAEINPNSLEYGWSFLGTTWNSTAWPLVEDEPHLTTGGLRFEGNALVKGYKGRTEGGLNITFSLWDLGLGFAYNWATEQSYDRFHPISLRIEFDANSCDVLWATPEVMPH